MSFDPDPQRGSCDLRPPLHDDIKAAQGSGQSPTGARDRNARLDKIKDPMSSLSMPPLTNLAARDVETLVHPYINLATFRETGPLIIERAHGIYVYDTE